MSALAPRKFPAQSPEQGKEADAGSGDVGTWQRRQHLGVWAGGQI